MSSEVPFLDLPAQNRALAKEMTAAFEKAVMSAAFIGGPAVTGFESEFAAFCDAKGCAVVNSGTDALRFALMAMGVKPGDVVVTVPNTFIATTEAISQAGAKIDFVDVEPDTSLMDPKLLDQYLVRAHKSGKLPKVIVPVHLYGQCCDMDAIMALAKKYDIKVLEDACQAHGATYKGRKAGSIGDAAAFSFYPGKNLGALGEGGAVTSNNEKIIEYCRIIRDHGQRTKYFHMYEGYNGRLDSIQCSFLSIKLKHLPDWNRKRQSHAQLYDKLLQGLKGVRPVTIKSGNESVHHLYVVHVENRDELQKHMKTQGVNTGLHYPMPLHLQECYAGLGFTKGSFPVTEKLAGQLLSLPMYAELTESQIHQTVEALKSFKGVLF